MLYLIDPSNYACHREDLDNMYRLRDKVFLKERSQEGIEKDEYDEKDAYYIVYKDKQGIIRGCQRLIEMTNHCMFDGPFRFALSNYKDFKRPGYWEVSRFAVDREYDENYTQKDGQRVFKALLAANMHFGLAVAKVETFVCITFPDFAKLMSLNGILLAPLKSSIPNNDSIIISAYSALHVTYEKLLKSLEHNSEEPLLYYTGPMYAPSSSERMISEFLNNQQSSFGNF